MTIGIRADVRSAVGRWWDGLRAGVRADFDGMRGAIAPFVPPSPGLHTYRIHPPGGTIRIHLRVDERGAGVLFVDVTDVVHLNPTAAHLAKLALDGVPPARARAGLLARHPDADRDQVDREVRQIYDMVERFSAPGSGCPTCPVADLHRAAPFSVQVDAPFKADLALTYGCNNACPHCYNEADRLPMASLPREDWFRVLDTLHTVGVPHIILTGGEATLHPDLPDIIRYADDLGLVVGLNTNGRRIAHQPYMRELAGAGLNHIQITLGSCEPDVHDAMMGARSFHQTVEGIASAIASGVHVITNTTLMRRNMGHAEAIIDFLFDLGIRTFAMNGMIYSGGGFADPQAIPEHELPPLLVRVRDHALRRGMRFLWYTPTEYCRMSPVELEIGAKRCNAGEYSICIEPNGDVLPCQSYYVAAGNILRDSWESVWQGGLFRSFRDREVDPRACGLPEKCWECPDLPLCGGGCRIEREARDGRRVVEATNATAGFRGSGGAGMIALDDIAIPLTLAGIGSASACGSCGSGSGGGGCGSRGRASGGGGCGSSAGGSSRSGCSCGSSVGGLSGCGSSTATSAGPTAGFVPLDALVRTDVRGRGSRDA